MNIVHVHPLIVKKASQLMTITGHLAPIHLCHWSYKRTYCCLLVRNPCSYVVDTCLAGTCKAVKGNMFSIKAIVVCVVSTANEGECLPARRFVLHPWLCVIEADIIDAEALFFGGALLPTEILLRMARDLHRCPCGDEVLGDVLPFTTTKHF